MIVPTWAGRPASAAGHSSEGTSSSSRRDAAQANGGSSSISHRRPSRLAPPHASGGGGSSSGSGRLRKPKSWRRWISDKLAAGFYAHGQTISKHQISTLLITCVVICSLFYPAVGIFLWSSKGGPGLTRGDASSVWQSMSTPLLDSFASSERRHYNSLRDLRMVWDDASDLVAMDLRDAAMIFSKDKAELCFSTSEQGNELRTTAKKQPHPLLPFAGLPDLFSVLGAAKVEEEPTCLSVRVEHLFITTDDVASGHGPKFGVLDSPVMQSALRLQQAIETALLAGRNVSVGESDVRLQCVRALSSNSSDTPAEACLTLSPLDYWSTSSTLLSADATPQQTLRQPSIFKNTRGMPISISTTLAGRWHLFNRFPRAEYLVLTFLLDAQDELPTKSTFKETSTAHKAWLKLVSEVTQGQVAIIQPEAKHAKELLLQVSGAGQSAVPTLRLPELARLTLHDSFVRRATATSPSRASCWAPATWR